MPTLTDCWIVRDAEDLVVNVFGFRVRSTRSPANKTLNPKHKFPPPPSCVALFRQERPSFSKNENGAQFSIHRKFGKRRALFDSSNNCVWVSCFGFRVSSFGSRFPLRILVLMSEPSNTGTYNTSTY